MLDPQKTLERQPLLRRIRELLAEIAPGERNLREGEARCKNSSRSSCGGSSRPTFLSWRARFEWRLAPPTSRSKY